MASQPTMASHITEAPLDAAQARINQAMGTSLQSLLSAIESGHVAPCLSCVEKLDALWQHAMMGVPVVPRTIST